MTVNELAKHLEKELSFDAKAVWEVGSALIHLYASLRKRSYEQLMVC